MNVFQWFRFIRNARGLWAYMHDSAVSKWHKLGVGLMAFFTVIYVLSPLDLIPDFLAPALLVVAFLDDIGAMALCFIILNQIGMKYAQAHQLPEAPQEQPLPPLETPDFPASTSPFPTP